MEEREKKELLEKIENMIYSADRFNEMSFRMVLEGLVNKVGEEGEFLLIRYMHSQEINLNTRISIIRVTGYIQGNHFLIPLKKIIDSEENIQVKKEAVISVAKHNNRQALNILNNALTRIKNPLLLQLINTEIGKIKKNNPVFALLPRFLEGEKDYKNFAITVDILKRILSPLDAAIFTVYLNCGKPMIETGAFDILCATGDMNVEHTIWTFFQERFAGMPGVNQHICDDFYLLTLKIKQFFVKHPAIIEQRLEDLGTQLLYIKDPRIREVYVSIICQSQGPSSISFINRMYDTDPRLQRTIIDEYSGNEAAWDLLFDKYRAAERELKKELLKSLLNCRKGIDHFYSQFHALEGREKDMIMECLPYGGTQNLSDFIKMVLRSDQYDMKAGVIARIREYFEFSVKDVLFDPERENEFFLMEQEYLDTITQLFPVTSVKKLFEKIAYAELPFQKIRKYLVRIGAIMESGFAFLFRDKELLIRLFQKVARLNSSDLNLLFLGIFVQIKTFDLETQRNIDEALNAFTAVKESKLTGSETLELRKIRKNLADLNFDARLIDDGYKALNQAFSQKIPDADNAANLVNRYSASIPLTMDRLMPTLDEHFRLSASYDLNQWIAFFYRFPILAYKLKTTIAKKAQEQKGYVASDLTRLLQTLPAEPFKIVIRLNDRSLTAALRDQCMELIPDIPVEIETNDWHEGDMLICDQDLLKDFILKNMLPSKKLFLLLDKRSDFSSFKSYNARPLVKPFFAYRIMKEILKDLYL